MKTIEGMLSAKGLKMAIVVSRFNEFITSKLLGGAEDAIRRTGGNTDDVVLVWVPGAYEIPLVAQKLAESGKFDAVIALGAVIRGSTPHFDYVAAEMSKGLASVGLQHRVPVLFGVLTCDTLEQALIRAGSKAGNKGSDCALGAIEMANLLKNVRKTEERNEKIYNA